MGIPRYTYDPQRTLKEVGQRRHAAEQARTHTAAELRQAIRKAHKDGMTKVAIAHAAGVSRQTVHNILS